MSELTIMDATGDQRIMWDPHRPEEVKHAKEMFDKMTKPASQGGSGYLAYSVSEDGSRDAIIREFDPAAEKVNLAPPLRGG